MSGNIRIGVGGWTYEPWRGTFYPEKLVQKRELEYASRQLTSIEINGTFYGSQKPETFAKWHDETPDGFVFALKAPRYATHRSDLSGAGPTIKRFVTGGILELKDKLGPINWQLMPTTQFNPVAVEGFLKLLPEEAGGRTLRHAIEARHNSFRVPEFVALARQYGVAIVVAGDSKYPEIADISTDFVYARLQTGDDQCETAYEPAELDAWAGRLKTWAAGGAPDGLPIMDKTHPAPNTPRDVFAFIIHEGKVRAPAGAMALIERVK